MKIISRKEAMERGLKRYFTGNPCKRGHVDERVVSGRRCGICSRMNEARDNLKKKERRREAAAMAPERICKFCGSYYKAANLHHRFYCSVRCKEKFKTLRRKGTGAWRRQPSQQRAYRRAYLSFGPQNPTGEAQWLRKNVAQLRAVKRLLRRPHEASQLLKEASKLGLNLAN